MSLTISEAQDVNTLIAYMLGVDRPVKDGDVPLGRPTSFEAQAAALHLTEKAYKKLHFGLTDRDVDNAWKDRRLGS